MWTLTLLACAGDPATPSNPADTADTGTVSAPMAPVFSFVVVADPHVTSAGDHADRLARAVEWIDAEAPGRGIELVFVVGDIGWGAEGLALSRELLDELDVPYLPLLGDNEVHFASEQLFEQTFADHFAALAGVLPEFSRGPVAVDNPDWGRPSWFQNFAFRYGGVTFLGLDWNSRDENDLMSEFAELHDFDGGTWPWFADELSGLSDGDAEDVLLFSHHPMHLGNFDLAEMERIAGVTLPVSGRVAAAFAGHIHSSYDWEVPEAGYDVFVTDATWDDEDTVRVVEIWSDGRRFSYHQELVVVPLLP